MHDTENYKDIDNSMFIEKTKFPQIHFKAYTKSWEKIKLGERGELLLGRSFPFSEQGGKSGIPFFKVSDMNIFGNEYEMKRANNYVSSEQLIRKKWKPMMKIPAVIFAKVGVAIMLERKRLVKSPFLIDNNLMAYAFDQNWDIEFCKVLFDTIYFHHYIQVGTFPSLNRSDIKNIEVKLPDIKEQVKIGTFFKTLDRLIMLRHYEYLLLKSIKQTMISNIFPRRNSKTSNMYFLGFSSLWRKVKLGDVAIISGGGTPNTRLSNYWDGDIDWYVPSEIGDQIFLKGSQKKITKIGLQKSSAKILPAGTVLFTSRARIGNAAILSQEGATNQGFQSIIPLKNELDTYFIYSQINEIKKFAEVSAEGTTFLEVAGKQMKKMPLLIPTLEEQIKIGLFFKEFDDLIISHQSKLEVLRKLESSLQYKMIA